MFWSKNKNVRDITPKVPVSKQSLGIFEAIRVPYGSRFDTNGQLEKAG